MSYKVDQVYRDNQGLFSIDYIRDDDTCVFYDLKTKEYFSDYIDYLEKCERCKYAETELWILLNE